MNIENLKTYWYPLFMSKDLKDKPLVKQLLSVEVVIVRMGDKVKCFKDQCPHRGVSLSNGSCSNKTLQCPYHGWSFDDNGVLIDVPGCTKKCHTEVSLTEYAVVEEDGLIWVRLMGSREFSSLFNIEKNFINMRQFKVIEGDFIHSIENFLDPMHTSFIHKNLLRSSTRQRMKISQEVFKDGFVTNYDLCDKQNGIINKLFDKGININRATFLLPGFAKIEYLKNEELLFKVSIFFIPIKKGRVEMCVDVSLPKSYFIPNSLIFSLLRPFLELALYQDKKILKEQYEKTQNKKFNYISLETDLVIDHLLHLLKDKESGIEKSLSIEL